MVTGAVDVRGCKPKIGIIVTVAGTVAGRVGTGIFRSKAREKLLSESMEAVSPVVIGCVALLPWKEGEGSAFSTAVAARCMNVSVAGVQYLP
jgi:hypothetical protein